MMGAFSLEVFEMLLCLIKKLTFQLSEGGDIIFKFGVLPKREILAKERLGEPIPSCEGVCI